MRTAQVVNVTCDRCDVVGMLLVAITCRSGALNNAVIYLRLLLLLIFLLFLLYLSLECRVFTVTYLKQTTFLGYIVL